MEGGRATRRFELVLHQLFFTAPWGPIAHLSRPRVAGASVVGMPACRQAGLRPGRRRHPVLARRSQKSDSRLRYNDGLDDAGWEQGASRIQIRTKVWSAHPARVFPGSQQYRYPRKSWRELPNAYARTCPGCSKPPFPLLTVRTPLGTLEFSRTKGPNNMAFWLILSRL